jgi:hypothetical protein
VSEGQTRYCLYTVAYVESDVCWMQPGETYAIECDCFCNDIYIYEGKCEGTWLTPLDPECRYPQ